MIGHIEYAAVLRPHPGNPEYELRSGTAAPLVGTLMEVLSSLWTKDGRLLVLAVGVARIRVRTFVGCPPLSPRTGFLHAWVVA